MTKITKNQLVFYIIINLKQNKYLVAYDRMKLKLMKTFFDELKSIINVLNSKTKKNASEILELQAAIEITAN